MHSVSLDPASSHTNAAGWLGALVFGDRDRGPELDLGEVVHSPYPLGVFEVDRKLMERASGPLQQS